MLTSLPPTACTRAHEAVSARLDGELNELEAQRLELHLRGCRPCRRFAAEAEAIAYSLRSAALEPAPAYVFTPRRRRVPASFAAAAAVLVVAAATGSSFFLGQFLARDGHTGPAGAAATTSPAPSIDPGLVAALQ